MSEPGGESRRMVFLEENSMSKSIKTCKNLG